MDFKFRFAVKWCTMEDGTPVVITSRHHLESPYHTGQVSQHRLFWRAVRSRDRANARWATATARARIFLDGEWLSPERLYTLAPKGVSSSWMGK